MLSQLTRAECLMIAGNRLRHKYGDAIPRTELQTEAAKLGQYLESSIVPSDHCYELINRDRSSFVSPLFVRHGSGTYKFLGPVYPYTGLVKWEPKGEAPRQVGQWENGRCTLAFDPRTQDK